MKGIIRIVFLLLGLSLVSTAWFMLVEKWSLVDAIYMTVITLSTVGFTEVHPLSAPSKIFVSLYLFFGLGVFTYGIVQIGESVIRAELGTWWRQTDMNDELAGWSGHFIVCGAGRMGWRICEDLAGRKIRFVALDSNEDVVQACRKRGWSAVCADATDDEALLKAGVARAAGLATALANDADNLYVVISTRLVSSKIRIIARAFDESSPRKLERAGANRVVSPYESGAVKMSQLLTNPRLNDFVEIISDRNQAFDLAGIPVTTESAFLGKRLLETDLRARGLMVIAIRRQAGELIWAPSGETLIEEGDELLTLGKSDTLAELL